MDSPRALRRLGPTIVESRGRRLVYFGGSDYFGFSWRREVRAAFHAAAERMSLSPSASRLTTGTDPLHVQLEAELSRFFGCEAATVTAAGYLAPLVAAQALAGEFTHALIDERAHGSLKDAAVLSGARVMSFRRDDPGSLPAAIRRARRRSRILVLCDGVSPTEGTVPPLGAMLEALPASARLLVDDAHGVGVLGAHGRGVLEHLGVSDRRVILTATLSKAFGAAGGVVLGRHLLRREILERSRAFAGANALALPFCAAALRALQLLETEGATLRRKLSANVRLVSPIAVGPIVSVAPRGAKAVESLRKRLLAAGIYPPLIRYAGGPAERFFRFAITTEHTSQQLAALRKSIEGLRRS